MLFDCLSSTTSSTLPRRSPARSFTVVPITLEARIADVCPVLVVIVCLLVVDRGMSAREDRFHLRAAAAPRKFPRHACRMCPHTSPICVVVRNEARAHSFGGKNHQRVRGD